MDIGFLSSLTNADVTKYQFYVWAKLNFVDNQKFTH